jgi:hypothetical protein
MDLALPHAEPSTTTSAKPDVRSFRGSGTMSCLDPTAVSVTAHLDAGDGERDSCHMADKRWTAGELLYELERFEADARRAGLRENSVRTYVDRSRVFVRWLNGDFQFQGPNART